MRSDIARALPSPLAEPSAEHCSRFRVGGLSVGLWGDSRADVTLVPSLDPFRVGSEACDINIHVKWVAALPPAPPERQLFDSGSVWRLYEHEPGFQFDFSTPVLGEHPYKRLLVDGQFRRASLLLSEECFEICDAAVPLEYPVDEVLITHRLTQEKAVELHACGIAGPDGVGNLFVGHSGAGKSTTARLWTESGDVEVLSDDRIIVRQDYGQVFMYGTPWHGEAAFASPASAPLARIFVLEHGRGNRVTRLSRSQAVGELVARSFVPLYRHDYVNSALQFLQEVAEAVPCYRYAFEPDRAAVERILEFRD